MTGFSLMIMPFYMVYAKEILKAGPIYIGRYLLLMVTGTILSNLLWGLIAKRRGSKAVVGNCILLGGLIPLLAIVLTPLGPAYFTIIFLLLGFIQSGRDIGFDPYLLDFAPEELRTTYLGIRGSLNWLVVLLPILGGVLINGLGYRITFTGVSLMMFIAYGFMGFKPSKSAHR
jgi:predicted MFS family arabinose efflux permease